VNVRQDRAYTYCSIEKGFHIEPKGKKRYTREHKMKVVVTHMRPDLDAVGSVWAIKRFLPNWEDAEVKFVPAGQKLGIEKPTESTQVIEKNGTDEVIHVDTGLGPLDHHQTGDDNTCAAKRSWQWAIHERGGSKPEIEAGDRLMDIVCEIDHFKEVFWPEPASDRYEITVSRILDGLKLLEKDDDAKIVEFGMTCLDSLYRAFQNKIWAERELEEKGIEFTSVFGKGIGVETFNDDIIHLSQRMGYNIAVRKDPKKGYIRIKASPAAVVGKGKKKGQIDLTPVYERLKEMDPDATWFLHVSKRMLLNGTTKNPTMKPTSLSLKKIVEVIKEI